MGSTKNKDAILEVMSAMLEQLPKFISHYARANDIHDNSVYLAPDASHTGLFDLLKEELATKSIEPPSYDMVCKCTT